LENSERALTKLLGSAEKAKALLTDVTDIVTGTPFRLDQFSAAATQLLAFNVEAEKIPEVLRTIGDAAALSIDPDLTVDRLVRTFGQIQAAGKLATEDINQLTEAGVPAWALLGNQLGKTTLEMRELVQEGAIPAEQAIDLLLNGIQNGTSGVNDTTVAFAGLSVRTSRGPADTSTSSRATTARPTMPSSQVGLNTSVAAPSEVASASNGANARSWNSSTPTASRA
jgi:tape measure domain-containing protein